MSDIPGVAAQPTVPDGVAELQRLQAAGFSNDDVLAHKQQETQRLLKGGFLPAEIDKYWGEEKPTTVTGLADHMQANIKKLAGTDRPILAKTAESPLEALGAGWDMSVPGLVTNGRMPNTVLPEDAGLMNKLMFALGQGVGDLPFIIGGGIAGGIGGGSVGTAVAPGPGTAVGTVVGAGVAGAGLPEAMRQILIGAYRRDEIKTWSDFMTIAAEGMEKTGKAMIAGMIAAPAGPLAGKVVGAGVSKVAGPLATKVASELTSPITAGMTYTAVGGGLDGHVPDANDFLTGAIMGLGFHAAGKVVDGKFQANDAARTVQKNLEDIYTQTGLTPWDAMKQSQQDPVIRQEIMAQNIGGEPVIDKAARVAPPEPKPYVEGKEGQPPKPPGKGPPEPPIEGEVIPPGKGPKKIEGDDITKLSEENINAKFDEMIGEEKQPDSLLNPQKLYRQWISELGPARDIDKMVAKLDGKYDRNVEITTEDMFRQTYASEMRAGYFIRYGTLKPGINEIKKTSDTSIMSAVRQVAEDKGNLNDWRNYMLAQRTIDKAGQGIDTGFDLQLANQLVKFGGAKYERATRTFNKVMDAVVDYGTDSGITSEAQARALKEANPTYITMRRVMGEDELNTSGRNGRNFRVSSPFKHMEGSDRLVLDPVVQTLDNMHQIVKMADRNRAIGHVLDIVDRRGLARDLGLKKLPMAEVKATIAKPGSDVFEPYLPENVKVALEPFLAQRSNRGSLNPNRFLYIRDGVPELWEAKSPEIAQLMRGQDNTGEANIVLETAAQIAKMQRTGITIAFDYMIRAPLRDQIGSFVADPLHPPPFVTWAKGSSAAFGNSERFQRWVANGGAGTALVDMDVNYLSRDVHKIFNETGTWGSMWNTVNHPVEAAQLLSERFDAASRIGYMERAEAMGLSPMKAATMSRKAYLDFAEKGTLGFMQGWARIVPFMRPSVLGMKQVAEAIKNNPGATFAYAALAITGPQTVLYALNYVQDQYGGLPEDQKYRNLPRWMKDTMFILPSVKGVRLKLAMPPELGFVMGGMTTRFLDHFLQNDPKAFDEWAMNLVGAVSPPTVPSVLLPPAEALSNTRLQGPLLGRPLIPASLEKASGDLRYTENTTEVAKALARVLGPRVGLGLWENANPIAIENYVREWTGTAGMSALRALNAPFNNDGRPWEVADIPFVAGFVVRNPGMGAQPIRDFFDEHKKLEQSVANLALATKRLKMGADVQGELDTAVEQLMPKLDEIKEAIQLQQSTLLGVYNDKKMNTDEKRQFAEHVYSDMINLARHGNELIQSLKRK